MNSRNWKEISIITQTTILKPNDMTKLATNDSVPSCHVGQQRNETFTEPRTVAQHLVDVVLMRADGWRGRDVGEKRTLSRMRTVRMIVFSKWLHDTSTRSDGCSCVYWWRRTGRMVDGRWAEREKGVCVRACKKLNSRNWPPRNRV